MTQHRNATRSQPYLLPYRADKLAPARLFLSYGVAWIGAIGLLSAGEGLAQTAPEAVPSAQELLSAPAPIPAPVPSAPAVSPAPEPAAPIAPPAPQPAVVEPAASAPIVSPPAEAAETPVSPGSNDAYIDSTDYSVGATQPSQQPSSVVISERSTGCQVVLQQGQGVPAAVCTAGRARTAAVTARANQSRIAANRAGSGSVNVGPLRVSAGGVSVGAMPSVRDFYNRTMRPAGRLGNGNVSAIFPLSIPAAITSAFGWRLHPISGDRRFHQGTDLGAPLGTPVLAAYTGRVAIADFMRGYGLTVVLQHSDRQSQPPTAETLYAHLSELFVQPGEWVEQGDVIGRVGSTGNSTGPHLHFEFRELTPSGWQALDPGQMLEVALAQLMQSVTVARLIPLPAPPNVPTIAPQPESIDPLESLRQWQQRNQDRNA